MGLACAFEELCRAIEQIGPFSVFPKLINRSPEDILGRWPRRPRPTRDQVLIAQPCEEIAADLLAENIL